MLTSTIYNIKVYCKDSLDNIIIHNIWQDNPIVSTCPLNIPGHTVMETEILDQISQNIQMVEDDNTGTNGIYRAIGYTFDVDPGPDTEFKLIGQQSYPYPMRVYVFTAMPGLDNIGDTFSFVSSKDTIVGMLRSSVTGGTLLEVNDTVIANMKIGFEVSLGITGTTGYQSVGECIDIDVSNKILTVSTPVSQLFDIGTPVMLTVKRVENIKMTTDKPLTFGSNTIGSSLAAAGLRGSLLYKNSSASAKTFSVYLETAY
jgi:hypothetical protein